MSTAADVAPDARALLELEHLKADNKKLLLENEKLALELKRLQAPPHWTAHVKPLLPIVTALLAVAGFWFGIWQYFRSEEARQADARVAEQNRLDQQRAADETFRRNLKRETARPLWEKQLSLYIEAAEKAAAVATTDDDGARREAEARFWVLYWGPLAAVEDVGLEKEGKASIEAAMVRFGEAIKKDPEAHDRPEMKRLALELAHAVRGAIAPAFDVQATDLADLRKAGP